MPKINKRGRQKITKLKLAIWQLAVVITALSIRVNRVSVAGYIDNQDSIVTTYV